MQSDSIANRIFRTYPLRNWRYPFSFVGSTNWSFHGNNQSWLTRPPYGLKQVTWTYPPPLSAPPEIYNNHGPYKSRWPPWTAKYIWLNAQWLALSTSEQSAWSANWVDPSTPRDHFFFNNALRIIILGNEALRTTPPPLPDIIEAHKIVFADVSVISQFKASGYYMVNCASPFPDYSPDDKGFSLFSDPWYLSGWNFFPSFPYKLRLRYLSPKYSAPHSVNIQPTDPQTITLLISSDFDFSTTGTAFYQSTIQDVVFWRDGRFSVSPLFRLSIPAMP
jgi:hypothetical protein